MGLPLEGIKILDLTRLLPGPFATLILGDLGAEIIKIEEPGAGDYVRNYAPFVKKESTYFVSLNRNKKSVKLNLKALEGKEIFRRLAETADMVIESFRPGVMAKLGLGFDDLKKLNPRLIFCAISGYGQEGPYRDRAGHDLNYISLAGITSLTGWKGERPAIPGAQIADIGGGSLYAVISILAALQLRHRDGQGRFIDVSMMDGALSFLTSHFITALTAGSNPGLESIRLNGLYPCYQVFETRDGKAMSLGALEPKFWEDFCEAIDRKDLVPDQFAAGPRREEVVAELKKIFRGKTRDEWTEIFASRDACCEPVLSLPEVRNHPQTEKRGLFFKMDHPTEGPVDQIRIPIRISGCPERKHTPSPTFGQHTEEVLKGLGFDDRQIQDLREKKVI